MGKTTKIDRTGQRYGRLLVTSPAPSKHGYARWWCMCDCGKTKNVSGTCLQAGKIKSCGCLRKETATNRAALNSEINTLTSGEAAFNQLYATYNNNAFIKNREFTLTKEQFKSLTVANCVYCGDGPKSIGRSSTEKTGAYLYNGVDRVDNNIGYIFENCVTCCKTCNWMKRVQSQDEFYESCLKVVKYFNNHKKSAEMSDSFLN
jgi:hypothetical protein